MENQELLRVSLWTTCTTTRWDWWTLEWYNGVDFAPKGSTSLESRRSTERCKENNGSWKRVRICRVN